VDPRRHDPGDGVEVGLQRGVERLVVQRVVADDVDDR